MLIPSHIVATELLARALNLNGTNYLLAHLFGWGIDFDHVVTQFKYFVEELKASYKRWKKRHIIKKFLPHRLIIFLDRFNKERSAISEPRSWIQDPVGILFILILSIVINNYIPIVFLFVHFLMDLIMSGHKYPLAPFSNKLKFKGWLPMCTRVEYIIGGVFSFFLIIWRMITGF